MAEIIHYSLLNENNDEAVEALCRALSSPIRLKMIRQLHEKPMTIMELAKENGLTNSTVIFHVRILTEAKIIRVRYLPSKKGSAQVCFINFLDVTFSRESGLTYKDTSIHEQSVPVGDYVDTTCEYIGMASPTEIYGQYLSAYNSIRFSANLIWTNKGSVTYAFDNRFVHKSKVNKLLFSFEICSETTNYRNDWKSNIFFAVNGTEIGHYLSPGDFGGTRGRLNPEWWPQNMTQFGMLVTLSVTDEGTFVNGEQVSEFTLSDLRLQEGHKILFSIYNKEDSLFQGGFNLFGKGIGNHDQDILLTAIYEE